MIKTIAPYITLGWNTVPLKGTLARLEDGTKTVPGFPSNWRVRYQEETNSTATALGGVITGRCSDIMAVDCDNEATWTLFRQLDPLCEFVLLSKGKGYSAGTFIYKYDEDLADNFSIADGDMALDFYSNKGFIYLATAANETKVNLATPLPAVTEMPLSVKLLLKQLAKKQQAATVTTTQPSNASCLAPIVEQFLGRKEAIPGLFRIITPKDFRDLEEYLHKGWLHPDSVPQGRGSEYLMKVSAILGADNSISQELYTGAMHLINSLFSSPMAATKLDKTVLDPMITGSASVNGNSIWQYDTDWQATRLILTGKRQVPIELAFDDYRNQYYAVDTANTDVKIFNRDAEFVSYLEAVAVNPPKKVKIKQDLPLVQVKSRPNKPFGFGPLSQDSQVRELNTFKQTPALTVFTEPDLYMDKYSKPVTTLKYLETLVPEQPMRQYLLRFVRTKLSTFNYSPVILYFLGAHGSGKDMFVGLLELMLGKVARPTSKEFLEKHNGWMVDTYFAQLDEYGNQLTTIREKEEALGKIKAYTGKDKVQIRQMRTDGFQYHHNVTFIMTANIQPLMLEEQDRRIAFFSTPNVLADQEWVLAMGGVAVVYDKVQAELLDFCYYLATEVESLTASDYVKPPLSANKQRLIADSMYAAQRIAYALKNTMTDYLVNIAEDSGVELLAQQLKRGVVLLSTLDQLYEELTDFAGNTRNFHKTLRSNNINLKRTTTDGAPDYNIYLTEVVNLFLAETEDDH